VNASIPAFFSSRPATEREFRLCLLSEEKSGPNASPRPPAPSSGPFFSGPTRAFQVSISILGFCLHNTPPFSNLPAPPPPLPSGPCFSSPPPLLLHVYFTGLTANFFWGPFSSPHPSPQLVLALQPPGWYFLLSSRPYHPPVGSLVTPTPSLNASKFGVPPLFNGLTPSYPFTACIPFYPPSLPPEPVLPRALIQWIFNGLIPLPCTSQPWFPSYFPSFLTFKSQIRRATSLWCRLTFLPGSLYPHNLSHSTNFPDTGG